MGLPHNRRHSPKTTSVDVNQALTGQMQASQAHLSETQLVLKVKFGTGSRTSAVTPHVTCLWFRLGQIIRSRSDLIFSCTQTKSLPEKSYCNWCWNVINPPFSRTWVWELELPAIRTAQQQVQVRFVPPVYALLTKVWHANESRYK